MIRHLPLICNIFRQFPLKSAGGVSRLCGDTLMESISKTKSLQLTNDLVIDVLKSKQSFPSLLQSCSSTLESINAMITDSEDYDLWNNYKLFNTLLSILGDFDYPNLKHIEISVSPIDESQTKRLISRCRNLSSIILRLGREFDWPDDVILEKLEKLEIQFRYNENGIDDESMMSINVSPILHPLIGKVPNLKHLKITSSLLSPPFVCFLQEFSPLFATTPSLEKLDLDFSCKYHDEDNFVTTCLNLTAAIPISNLPKLTHLKIDLKGVKPKLPSKKSFSRPETSSFKSQMIKEINNEDIALPKPKYRQELELPQLEMTKDLLTKIMTGFPSIATLEINKIDGQALQVLSQLDHLPDLRLFSARTTSKLINMITSVPSLAVWRLSNITDIQSPKEFIEFVTSTASRFHRNLEIRLSNLYIHADNTELDQMKASLDEVKISGGPEVEMKRLDENDTMVIPYWGHPNQNQYNRWHIHSIRYSP